MFLLLCCFMKHHTLSISLKCNTWAWLLRCVLTAMNTPPPFLPSRSRPYILYPSGKTSLSLASSVSQLSVPITMSAF
jgi:hypothetical protein